MIVGLSLWDRQESGELKQLPMKLLRDFDDTCMLAQRHEPTLSINGRSKDRFPVCQFLEL